MFEIGGGLFNVSINDVQQGHDVMSLQGPFVTHMQHCVQRIEVSGGEQRSSCIKEMHAISSTPIRNKNVRRESPLHHPQATARPSIYSVALSPDVSPVGKSNADLNNYSPSEKEFSNHMDAIVPSTSAHGRESLVRIGIDHHLARNIAGNDFKRNVSRRLPMVTAIQRTEQYVPLEIVSDEDASESNAFTKRSRSCRRPVNAKGKPSVHFKTNSYRGLSTKYDSIDSGRGGSAAVSSGTRTPFSDDKHSNNGCGLEDQESDSDSGLSHCTDGPSRSRCHEEDRLDRLHSVEEDGTRNQVSESPRFSSKGGKMRRVSRFLQYANNHQYDYEPLEIVSDDDNEDVCNPSKRPTKNQPKGQGKRIKAPNIVAGTAGRRKLVRADLEDVMRNDEKLSVAASHRSFGDNILRQDENEDAVLSKTVAVIDSLLKIDEDDFEKENRHLKKKRQSFTLHNRCNDQSYRADYSDGDEPKIHLSRSKNIRHCSESFSQDEFNQGSFRSMGDASVSGASGYNGSAMEVDEDGEDGEYGCDLRENELHNKNRGNVANNSAEELDESYEHHDNSNTSHFHNQNSRIHQLQMSGFFGDNSRTRYGESFDSDYQCGNVERGQYATGDDEDLDESGNVSGLLEKNTGHRLQQRRKQIKNIKGMKRGFMENSGNEDTYSDDESQGEMNADISGRTDFEPRRNVQKLIQSRNDSYYQQDSFNSQSIMRKKATRYLSPRGSNLNNRNGVIREIAPKQLKGALKVGVKRKVPSKASSVVALEQNLSSSRKRGRHALQKLGRSQTGSSSEEKDGSSACRQPSKISGGRNLSVGKKRPRKCLEEADVVMVPSGKKVGKVRAKSNSDTKSSDTAESNGPPAKIKRVRAKSTKTKKAHYQLKGNAESQSESPENAESSSEVRVPKNSKIEPSETKEFETPPVKAKRGRTKATKSKEATGKQTKGNLKSQSESSETAESGSSPPKKKRGRPPQKSKKCTDDQSKVLTKTKSCDSQSEECGESSTLPKGRKRGRKAKTGKASQALTKGSASSEQNQSKVVVPESENGQSSLNKQKKAKAPRKKVKKQNVDPDAENLPKNSDGLHVSSSDSESDKSGVHKRRPLFSSEKFTNELLLKQNEVLPEVIEKKTDVQPKLSPLREKKKPAESSSDYLRKKVLTMRLGTSAFLNSVIEENALVVTSTPKKSMTESRTSSTSMAESVSDEVFEEQTANSSKVEGQPLSTSVKLDGDSEKCDKLNKSQVTSEVIERVVLPVHSNDDVLNKKIESFDEPVPDSKSEGSSAKPEKKIPERVPLQGLKVNDRILSLPLMSTSAAGLVASSSGRTSRGSVPVVVDGSSMELELFADYSKIPFRSRSKESKNNGVQYGAALDVLGLGTGYIHLTPGTEKGLQHPKSFNMVFLILDGHVKVKIHESDILAKPGDFFAVPKGCKYNLTGTGDRNAIVAYFKSKAL